MKKKVVVLVFIGVMIFIIFVGCGLSNIIIDILINSFKKGNVIVIFIFKFIGNVFFEFVNKGV